MSNDDARQRVRAGLESAVDYADPQFPAFLRLADETNLNAHRDPGPGHPNWLDTCGHDQGGMIGRYIGAENPPRALEARVVKLSDLASG